MAENRVTQADLEVSAVGDPSARVTAEAVELVVQNTRLARVSHAVLEVSAIGSALSRVTALAVEILVKCDRRRAGVSWVD